MKSHLMNPIVQQIAQEYKEALVNLYGNNLAEVILFGSYARGDQHKESDIDFAIVFRDHQIRPSAELFKIAPVSSRLSLKYGLMISTLPVTLHKKETSMQGVYRDIRKEGIVI